MPPELLSFSDLKVTNLMNLQEFINEHNEPFYLHLKPSSAIQTETILYGFDDRIEEIAE